MRANPQLVGRLSEILQRHGFRRRGTGYCRRGLGVRVERLWCTFTRRAAGSAARRGPHGPGLWKTVGDAARGKARREFSLPLALIAPADVEPGAGFPGGDPLLATIDWVEASARGKVPPAWRLPPPEPLAAALPIQRRTVQAGPFARQAQLICGDGRLAVRIPIVPQVPEALAPARRAWLERVVDDAEQHCRMVRVVSTKAAGRMSSVAAEVDLTGVPHFMLPDLLTCGLDAAAYVASRFVWSIGFLADPAVRATAWDVVPSP